jgi:hypothetical protein
MSICSDNFVIIGNTSLATLYATNIINSYSTQPGKHACITMLYTGNDQTTDVYTENLNYVQGNSSLILKMLNSERLHNIVKTKRFGSNTFNSAFESGTSNARMFEEYYQYYTGSGPLGDSITAYYQPLVGPWFTTQSQNAINTFINNNTIDYGLRENETIVANNLIASLGLTPTTSVVATKPSILTRNYIYVTRATRSTTIERQLFKNEYINLITNVNDTAGTVINVTHVTNIYLENTNNVGYYNVTYNTIKTSTQIQIPDAFVIWADDLYDYARITGISDVIVANPTLRLPVSYRIVYRIPKNNPATGVDLSDVAANGPDLGDGLTTRLTFNCTNAGDVGASITPTWNVTCYTTDIDLANILPGNLFVNTCDTDPNCCFPDQTLLIVEATSLHNTRQFGWDALNLSVAVDLNQEATESSFRDKFIDIFAKIYEAYTAGIPVVPISLFMQCGVSTNTCIYQFPLEHTIERETPQILVMRMISDLFGNNTYPNPNYTHLLNTLL